LQTTSNLSAIQRATGLHWRTIRRYQQWAVSHGVLDKPLPPVEELHALMATTLEVPPPPQTVSSVEPYREVVTQLHAQGKEGVVCCEYMRPVCISRRSHFSGTPYTSMAVGKALPADRQAAICRMKERRRNSN
jgi:hypothetical protein